MSKKSAQDIMKHKALLALFLISLAINIGLGFRLLRRPAAVPEPPRVETLSSPKTFTAQSTAGLVQPAVTSSDSNRFTWQSIESPDYKQYAANLRSIGCPEGTLRDILRADVNQLYEEKKKKLRRAAPKFEYWRKEKEFLPGVGREAWAGMLALDEERDSVLRSLGIEPDQRKRTAKSSNRFEWMLDFLDDDKKASILRLRTELEDKLAVRQEGSLDARGLEALQKELEDSIKRLLTHDEALQYDLRLSPTATTVRQQLQGFDPTEEEFVSIFKLRKALDDEYGQNPGNDSAAERNRRQEAETQMKEQIKQTLGPQRFAEYEMALETGYQYMYIAVKQAGLGTTEARQLYTMKRVVEEQVARIRNDQSIAADQRSTALETIRQETERSIQALLGDKGWQQLSQGNGVRWLNRLNRSSAQSGAAPSDP
jgi:hypothetical protein